MKPIIVFIIALSMSAPVYSQSADCVNTIKADSIQFLKKSVFLDIVAKKKLYRIAVELKNNPGCKVAVTGFGNNCLTCHQTSWDRVFSVVKYIRQWGVDSTRFIFSAAQDGGNPLFVSIRSPQPGEDGPALTAPYIPCYSYHRLTKKRCKGNH